MKYVYRVVQSLVVELHDDQEPQGDDRTRRLTEQFTEVLDQVGLDPGGVTLLETEDDGLEEEE